MQAPGGCGLAAGGAACVRIALIVGSSLLAMGCSTPLTEPRDAAEDLCAWHPDGLPEEPFTTDICSASPDGDWGNCCIEHDMYYWCGGTSEQRAGADERFRECVDEDHTAALAWTLWMGVRAGGHPVLLFPWRWGYGRPWPTAYLDSDVDGNLD